jgi:hypothetical protein
MCRKIISTVITIVILNLICSSGVLAQRTGLSPDEVKTQIAKLGTGPKAVVRITLNDKRKMQGWLALVAEDHFSLTDEKTGSVNEIRYADVSSVKSLKPSKSAIAVGAMAVIGAAALIFLFAGAKH